MKWLLSTSRADCTSSRIAPNWQRRAGDEAVDDEDLEPRNKPAQLRDLSPMSIAELESYIGDLESEIVRARNDIEAKRKQRGGAESLFKR
jgi:uncharacterized small protein (DUF1192 family)